MHDTNKYLIHATISTDGVVERSDVVGAIFGQTEGLLGDELDLRQLQETSKIGRIDVEIDSHQGQSVGEVTIATSLDKAETATLAAALETISRVGPCRATVEVTDLEDLRAAKRRRIVDRAQELLAEAFDDSMMSSEELVEAVRRRVRVESITEYEGLPAGPRVEDSDAIVIVEGRSDVLALLEAGIKNAIAVEGTDVLDGDRGGDLILKELGQVGDVDYVAFAPEGRSVEDLSRHEILAALRRKIDHAMVADRSTPHEVVDDPARTSGGTVVDEHTAGSAVPPDDDAAELDRTTSASSSDGIAVTEGGTAETASADPDAVAQSASSSTRTDRSEMTDTSPPESSDETSPSESSTDTASREPSADTSSREPSDELAGAGGSGTADTTPVAEPQEPTKAETEPDDEPVSLREHIKAVLGTGTCRLLDDEGVVVDEDDVANAIDTLERDPDATVLLLDDTLEQRLLDIAADNNLERIVAAELGAFTKRPTNVRVHEVESVLEGS
jgi:DNA primase